MQVRDVSSDCLLRLRSTAALDAALGVVSCVGSESFGKLVIEQINRFAPVGWWTVYRLRGAACPMLHFGGSVMSDDVISRAWSCYQDGLWKQDRSFGAARDAVGEDRTTLAHVHASEIGGSHQARIYNAFGLTERVSLVRQKRDGNALCVNLYRSQEMRAFSDDEIDHIECMGDLILRAVESQLKFPTNDAAHPLDGLPRREREVCDRLLRGMTYDGIAADLGLSLATVKTYRDRAFDRLGIHFRSQLFALMLPAKRAS